MILAFRCLVSDRNSSQNSGSFWITKRCTFRSTSKPAFRDQDAKYLYFTTTACEGLPRFSSIAWVSWLSSSRSCCTQRLWDITARSSVGLDWRLINLQGLSDSFSAFASLKKNGEDGTPIWHAKHPVYHDPAWCIISFLDDSRLLLSSRLTCWHQGKQKLAIREVNQQTDQPDMHNEWTPQTLCCSNVQCHFPFISLWESGVVDHPRHHSFVSPIWQDLGRWEIKRQAFVSQQQHINPSQVWVRSPRATLGHWEDFVQKCRKLKRFRRLGSLPLGTYVLCYCAAGTGGTAVTLALVKRWNVWGGGFEIAFPATDWGTHQLQLAWGDFWGIHLSPFLNLSFKVEKIL